MTFCFCFLFSAAALAVDVEPARLELTIPIDQPTQGELTITNRADRPVSVRIASGAYRAFQSEVTLPTAQDWVRFEPGSFTLSPGASSLVTYRITPPPALINDTSAEYLAAVLIDELPVEALPKEGTNRVTIVPRLALPIYLKIKGRERLEMEITDLSARAHQALTQTGEGESAELLRLDTVLKNHGSVHARPAGTLALFDQAGAIIHAGSLGRTVPLFPGATLTVPVLMRMPVPGQYKAVVTVEDPAGKLLQRERRFEVTGDNRVVTEAAE